MKRLLLSGLLLVAHWDQASGQVPTRFENLQFFPKDIARDSLLMVMRGFSFALGVRCVYCHVGEDSPTLAGVDFKADERVPKKKAREMLHMTAQVNESLAKLPERSELTVKCVTCHRGITRPIALEDSLYHVIQSRGAAGAAAVYDSLRTRYYGGAAFDFGPRPMITLAERLRAQQRSADAVTVLQKNAEHHPNNWGTHFELGLNYQALNRTADAIAAYQAVLRLLPGHAGSEARLRALTGR